MYFRLHVKPAAANAALCVVMSRRTRKKGKRAFLRRNTNAAPKTKGWRTCRHLAVAPAKDLSSCRAVLCCAVAHNLETNKN